MENEATLNPAMEVKFSEQRNELFSALAKARQSFGKIVKSSNNPFFKSKYADLAEILEATSDALSANGLAVMQFPTMDIAGRVVIVTVLGHSSGQWAEGRLPMPVTKNDAQGVGSAITYGRRYSFGALVSVASEADDDGNAATGKKESSDKLDEALDRHMSKTGEARASVSLVNAFRQTFERSGKTEAQLLTVLQTRYSASRPSELTADELSELVKWVVSKEPLEETLETSVKAARKPQETPQASTRSRTLISDPEAPEIPSFEKVAVRVTGIVAKKRKAPAKGEYLILECFNDSGNFDVYSWDSKINDQLLDSKNKLCIFEIARSDKGISLKHLVEVDRIKFENDQPILDMDSVLGERVI